MSKIALSPTLEDEQLPAYFNKGPLWAKELPNNRFEVFADATSGRIPATRIENWREFTSLIEDPFFNRSGVHLVYRGQRRYDWGLTPTLGRLMENGIVTKELADEQLAKFRRAIRGRIEDRALLEHDEQSQCDELWAVGQHHGLMTPLIDWTYSPYVALFFAFATPDAPGEKKNPYRVVYLLNKTFVDNDELCPEIRVLEPRKDDHGRLVNQAGLFTFSPYDATLENKLGDVLSDTEFPDDELRTAERQRAPDDTDDYASAEPEIFAKYICKIYIKNEDRDGCLRHLRRMNVHHASLFPDLIGAAEYCNTLISDQAADNRFAKAEPPETLATAVPTAPAPTVPNPIAVKLADMLRTPQVEPARLVTLTEEIAGLLDRRAGETEEQRAERLRTVLPVTLRRYAYPADQREPTVRKLLELSQPQAGPDAFSVSIREASNG
ncbi:MAG: FRG domain-containing protein [Opitutus sp.]|nr:FRG domain-containing protein [Opitutus sp.]MCS6246043.1 FRG domain-containing protein [Opitutus sp.]MCS6273926.1 FRG domain-containing protein [Opitutus sp.]MCS6276230.1 FRG domain-containing protein [Opitutus sp.]MCS6301324.1 FRG domain-containing protein [Opitutus sp.]